MTETQAGNDKGLIATGLAETRARTRASRIRTAMAELEADAQGIVVQVEEAYEARDWEALGYASWEAYCAGEFGVVKLGREARLVLVGALRQRGLSTRAIAPVVGISHTQVQTDIDQVETEFPDDALPETVISLDGRARPARRVTFGRSPTEEELAADAEIVAAVEAAEWYAPVTTALGFMRAALAWAAEADVEGRDLGEVRGRIEEIGAIALKLKETIG